MDPMRRTALVAGILYLVTFIFGIPPALLLRPALTDPAFLIGAGPDLPVLVGSAFDIVNALACIGTAVALFSVLKRQHEGMALGFVTTRLVEGGIILVGATATLSLVTLRQPGATGMEATALTTLGGGLVSIHDWTFLLGPGLMPAFNALLLGTLLYRSRLVPRWMPALGLIGAPLLLSSSIGIMFGVNDLVSAWTGIATAPIFIWELSLGLYLALKGFRRDAPVLSDGVVAGDDASEGPSAGFSIGSWRLGRPAPHRLWLVPGVAAGVAAGVVSEQHGLGILPVLVFGTLPHTPVLLRLGWPGRRGRLGRRGVLLFNAFHQPLVPIVLAAGSLAGLVGPLWLVAGLAWLGHIVVDLGLGDGLRDKDGRPSAPAWSGGWRPSIA